MTRPMTRPGARALFVTVLSLGAAGAASGCFASSSPLLPEDVAAAVARHPMRRLETPNLRLYYPESRRDQAYRSVDRLEACASALKGASHVHNGIADRRMTLILPEFTFNNAFASPPILGYEPLAVVPTYGTIDAFSLEMGLPPDPVLTACHELTHYVQFQQIAGFARIVNLIFGESYSPQLGFDPWFFEGLAVHYETLLQPGVGRLAWPMWNGIFAAGVAGRRLNGGDLSALNRDFHLGNHYLVGSHFVRFLAQRYGEYYLWKLIGIQARAIFFPLWVNIRFWQAYDKSLSTLIDEFADDVARRYPVVARPPEQRMLSSVGNSARYGRALDGTEALLLSDRDTPPLLVVRAPNGEVRLSLNLIDVVPPRRLTIGQPLVASSPSFTADGRAVYFALLDIDATFQATRLVRVELPTGRLTIVHRELRGGGGSISPDGRTYVFSQANGDRHDLAVLDLDTGSIRVLAQSAPGSFVSLPRYAPDGKRIVATVFDGQRFRIRLFAAATGASLSTLTDGTTPVHDASWAGNDAVVFLSATTLGQGFQVYLTDLRSWASRRLTRAPYLAFQPQVARGTLRFLNRDGGGWTLDEIPLPEPLTLATAVAPVFASASSSLTTLAALVPTPGIRPDVAPPPSTPPTPPPATLPPTAAPEAIPPMPTPPAVVPTPPPPAGWVPPAAPGWTYLPMPPPPAPLPLVESDEPYRSTDHLLVPLLHGIEVAALGRQAFAFGAVLAGNDRLQLHRWVLSGVYQFASARPGYGAGFGYTNSHLAPVRLSLTGLLLNLHDTPPRPPGAAAPSPQDYTLDKRQRQVNVVMSRAFYENPVALGFTFTEDDQPGEPTVAVAPRRVVGPTLSASFSGVESTPYSGARRALFAGVDAAAFPGAWSSVGATLADLRGELDVTLPLPFSRRHRLFLSVVGRAITGLPDGQLWLQVGGGGASTVFSRRSPDRGAPDQVSPAPLPPDVRFFEPLRGYEDYPLATDRVGIVRATYRYPFIIDWGSASTFGVLPSFFLRELVLWPFVTAAQDGQSRRHTAAGASFIVSFALGAVPFSLAYQLARRFDDDRAYVHLITLD